MQNTSSTHVEHRRGSEEDPDYRRFLAHLQQNFDAVLQAGDSLLFTTDTEKLFDAYLSHLPPDARQHHTCNCCRQFVNRFGGLVTLDEHGRTKSALWSKTPAGDAPVHAAAAAMASVVENARVTGVFLARERVWGKAQAGGWDHMHVTPPREIVHTGRIKTAGQDMAERREDFRTLSRALSEFSHDHVRQALNLLRTDSLYRSEKVLGVAEFLDGLHQRREGVRRQAICDNLVWRAVATAPAGFCHPRSSMIGTLLEDIAAGHGFDDVSRRFAAKMNPLQYQRPQAAPSAGNIARAEKLVAELGLEPALHRRYATLADIEALWHPRPEPSRPSLGGVFGHLLGEAPRQAGIEAPQRKITWEKFRRTVLPNALKIEYLTGAADHYCALVTQANDDAPPILQWDSETRRNPVSWYVYPHMIPSSRWGLPSGRYVTVTAVTLQPSMWHDEDAFPHHGKSVILILEGAKDGNTPGLGLFPEILKAELREVRATIEAYSKGRAIGGREQASANGVRIYANRTDLRHVVRVTTDSGAAVYNIDRWD